MSCRRQQSRVIHAAIIGVLFVGSGSARGQVQPANPSFSATSDVILLPTAQTQFGTFRQGNPGATLNFNVYNRPAATGTTSPMSLVVYPPSSIGDTSAIALQTVNITGLQPVGVSGTPNAQMQLVVTTSQVGDLSVSYQLEFSSDSLPAALHKSLAIAAYATVLRHGDFNADGHVDAGDYVAWRKTRGQSVTPYTRADDNGDGLVNDADYNAWRHAFTAAGSGSSEQLSSLATPEPASALLILVSASFLAFFTKPRRS
jgi:hypothetical protein